MMPAKFSHLWTAMGTAVGDHLWQSTLVLLVVALLAFALKENQARVRYWLWLAASLKFLIPFCLVVTVGQRLAPSSAATNTQLHQVVSAVGYAFAPPPILDKVFGTIRATEIESEIESD